MTTQFLGSCIGVRLKDRGKDDPHQLVTVLVEDDENWHDKMTVSSFWLDEAIAQLQAAKQYLETHCEKGPWGYKRKMRNTKPEPTPAEHSTSH